MVRVIVAAVLSLSLPSCASVMKSYEIINMGNCSVCVDSSNYNFAKNYLCSEEQWKEAESEKCFKDPRREYYKREG